MLDELGQKGLLSFRETDDSSVKSARVLHPNRTKRGSRSTSDTIRNDRCSGCYDNAFSS